MLSSVRAPVRRVYDQIAANVQSLTGEPMSDHVCDQCGATNAPGTQFCVQCDFYLGWDAGSTTSTGGTPAPGNPATAASAVSSPPSAASGLTVPVGGAASGTAASTDASRAQVPRVELAASEAVLEPDEGATVEMRIFNTSPIVDGFRIDMVTPPAWLTLAHNEISLYPNRDESISITFGIGRDSLVPAQTIQVGLRIRSLTNPDKYAEARVKLTVPRVGGPVSIRTRPTLVRLNDETTGRVQISLDNSASNYPQRLELAGSDAEGVVRFSFSPPTVELPAGKGANVDLRFEAPALDYGQVLNRQLTISATDGEATVEATVAVTQQRSEAPVEVPLRLRLEPSVLRVRDCPMADLNLIVDNRGGTRDHRLMLAGRDPEGSVRFSFRAPQILARAGQATTTRLTVEATAPQSGENATRPFTIIASEGDSETEASGTLIQVTSPAPITTASIRLEPEELRRRNRSSGRFRLVVDNSRGIAWLKVGLFGSDPEHAVRFTFSPPRFDIPPGQVAWGWVAVSGDPPVGGEEVMRKIRIDASDGRESVQAAGVFTQSTSDWRPVARIVLTLLGGLLAIIGAFTPWMVMLPDYYVDQLLELGAQTEDPVERTQPGARAAVLVLAALMLFGVTGKGGKLTRTSAVLLALSVIGYFVFVTTKVGTGGPMYGAILILAGAVLGYVGGLLAKR